MNSYILQIYNFCVQVSHFLFFKALLFKHFPAEISSWLGEVFHWSQLIYGCIDESCKKPHLCFKTDKAFIDNDGSKTQPAHSLKIKLPTNYPLTNHTYDLVLYNPQGLICNKIPNICILNLVIEIIFFSVLVINNLSLFKDLADNSKFVYSKLTESSFVLEPFLMKNPVWIFKFISN